MAAPVVPNFFIVGAGKAGTTSLHRYLAQHPQVYMSPVKEPCFFASEIRPDNIEPELRGRLAIQSRALPGLIQDGKDFLPYGWIALDWDEYLRLFQDVRDERAVGEASAAYLWSESAAAAIRERVPAARIVMILRDPAERAFSQYLHQARVGLTRVSFRQQIEQCRHSGPGKLGPLYPFLEAGLYYRQVKRFLDLFPRDQIRIYWYEEDWRNTSRLLTDVFSFLGVDPTFHADTSNKDHERSAPRWLGAHYGLKKLKIWYPLKALVPASLRPALKSIAFRNGKALTMSQEDRRHLIDYYCDDIIQLSTLLNHDLSAWLA